MSNIINSVSIKVDESTTINAEIGAKAGNVELLNGTNLEAKMGQVDEALAAKADLDPNGRIPYSQLPESAMELKGTWNASTNTPTLVDGTGDMGDFYIVETAGTWNNIEFRVNDRVMYDGAHWIKLKGGDVASVNGHIGAVVLGASDVGALPDNTTLADLGVVLFKNQTMSTDSFVLTNDVIHTSSLIDIYYSEEYNIEPTYSQIEGSLTITLPEIPAEPITFSIKVVN